MFEDCTSDALLLLNMPLPSQFLSCATVNSCWFFSSYQRIYFSIPTRKKFFLVFLLSLKKFEKMSTCRPKIMMMVIIDDDDEEELSSEFS